MIKMIENCPKCNSIVHIRRTITDMGWVSCPYCGSAGGIGKSDEEIIKSWNMILYNMEFNERYMKYSFSGNYNNMTVWSLRVLVGNEIIDEYLKEGYFDEAMLKDNNGTIRRVE